MNLSGALTSHRYWRSMCEVQAENAQRVDVDTRLVALRQTRNDADRLLSSLKQDGVVTIRQYWSADECTAACEELDRIFTRYPDTVRLSSGGSDKRMFGVEAVSAALARFHDDAFAKGIGEALGGLELYNFATLGARIDATDSNNGSGDGWHRDGFGFQFKAILYLSDVTDENGPFEFLPGSHKPWRVALDTAVGDLPAAPQSRFTPEAVDRVVSRLHVRRERFLAKAGTLILTNTSGLHRGAPLSAGRRYALTNYYYHPYQLGDTMLEKFRPLAPGVAERVTAMLDARKRT